ncbi:hypothetical protein [Aestuariivirga sp.]|uniref:hypothetical protein n=1 Tax=Aestuariivirga sp. TaxID=2650926 RepID=UPI0039E4E5C6
MRSIKARVRNDGVKISLKDDWLKALLSFSTVTPAKAGAQLPLFANVVAKAGFRLARDISHALDQGARPE